MCQMISVHNPNTHNAATARNERPNPFSAARSHGRTARPSCPPAPASRPPSADTDTNKSAGVSSPLPAERNAPHTNATTEPSNRVAAIAPPPPAKSESSAAQSPKVELVRLSEEEPIRAARDTVPDTDRRAPDATTTQPAVTDLTALPVDNRPTSRPSVGFVSRLNPRNWFRAKENPAPIISPRSGESTANETKSGRIVAASTGPASSPPVAVPRYRYHSPTAPKSGNRAEAERRLAQGVRAQERNRPNEAVEEYRQATNADPSFFDAHYNLGVAAYEVGDLPLCLVSYEYALAINPRSVKARFNLAVALQKADYPLDAAGELEKLLADNASEARAHLTLANLYAQQLGEPARAREHYLRLLELEPQHPQATAIRYWLEANP